MAGGPLSPVLQFLRRLAPAGDLASLSDGQLLDRFLAGREEPAFAALLQRHGPMVWAVCRHLLASPHDAEDAFQATFLVLARRAAALTGSAEVGPWLHAVAHRVAVRARAQLLRRQARLRQGTDMNTLAATEDPAPADWQPVLHEEVRRLPAKYRSAVVLCYLEGLTNEEAARQLRWPVGTLKTRLLRARGLLHRRLTRRGLALSAGAVATVLTADAASAAVPAGLMETMLRATTGAAVSPRALAWAEGVLRTMLLTRLTVVAVALLAVAAVGGGGAGWLALHGTPGEPGAGAAPAKEEPKPLILRGHTGDVTCLAFAPDGKTLFSGANPDEAPRRGEVKRWDAATGKELPFPGERTFQTVDGVAFAPDGRTVAVTTRDPSGQTKPGVELTLWDPSSGEHRATLRGCGPVAFDRDGKRLAAAENDFSIRVWDAATLRPAATLEGHRGLIVSLAFAPDDRTLASASNDGTARLWDIDAGRDRRTFEGTKGYQYSSVAFAPDGGSVAAVGLPAPEQPGTRRLSGGEVVVWEVRTGERLRRWGDGDSGAIVVAFAPGGRVLATGGYDHNVRLWDAADGKELATLTGHSRYVAALAFSPDGRTLASGSWDGTVRLWDVAAVLAAAGPADPAGTLWSDYWRRQHKGARPSMLRVELTPGASVKRTKDGLLLPVTITNRSGQDVVTTLAHEWHGGEWPSTDLYASVTPAKAAAPVPFHPVYLAGERSESPGRTTLPPGKSLDVELRLDWPGTGSVQAAPLLRATEPGTYRVRLLLVFEAKGVRQFVAGPAEDVELPPDQPTKE
jgi:RNA polymerase sigma factor (sigma-70 family)